VQVAPTICATPPIPFDEAEVDRELASAHTLSALASTANRVVFDLYDHCALVVRFFIVDGGEPRLAAVFGDRRLVSHREALRRRAVATGRPSLTLLGRPAGFRLVVAPLIGGDEVSGLVEFVVPAEMADAKADRLALVLRSASSSLQAWRRATEAGHQSSRAAGTSFALGMRLAGVVSRAGELGAAVRSAVELLARELKAPVAAWRVDATGEVLRMSASTGLGHSRRAALEDSAGTVRLGSARGYVMSDLRQRVAAVLGADATVVDGGSVVLVTGGKHEQLELCGRDLAALLDQLPEANVSALAWVDDEGNVREWGRASVERTRLQDLTPRELQILAILAGGSRSPQIAERLVISEKTVKTHVQNILRKLHVNSRLEAAAVAVRAGFVPLSTP
jgi:DNA-binding NarL/FixJ family response regulator